MGKIERTPRTGEANKVYPEDMRITMAIPYRYIGHGIPDISRYTLIQFEQMAEATAKAGYEVFINTDTSTSNTPVTRTKIVERFKGDWLLMLDPDAFPEADTANKLLIAAKEDPQNLKKIIAVPAVRPSYPHLPAFSMKGKGGYLYPCRYGHEFGDDELMATETKLLEVDGSGFHCVLIHRDVFRAVPYPWFPLNVPDPDSGIIYGHDYSFCFAAKRAGFQTYIDFSCRVGHYGIKPFTLADHRAIVKSNPQVAEDLRHADVDVDGKVDDDENIDHVMNLFKKPEEPTLLIPKEALE